MRRVLTTTESSVRSKLVRGAALLSAACALSLAPARAGQEIRPLSMLGDAVTFTLPEAWQKPSYQGTSLVGLLHMTVIYPAGEVDESGDEKKLFAQIIMSASVDDGPRPLSLKARSDETYTDTYHQPPLYPDLVKLSDAFHGDSWRTLAWKATIRGEPHVNLARFGLVGKKWVGLSVMLLTDGSDPEPLRRAIADFNAMCESLKIDGKNQLDSKLDADKILELLRAGKKK
ncbi:MAG TPA: hypothetical protein VM914_14150 [Pyrinomonadaceae bacterium]|jgi:hypothetical protein|nr:hypothetical protein [Pyrinomonadaceae bacterium]